MTFDWFIENPSKDLFVPETTAKGAGNGYSTGDLKRGVDDRPSRRALRLKSLSSITEYQHPERLHVYIDFGE